MVGWLIEQQQVGALPDDHAKDQARLLAAAHAANGLLHHVATEVEGAQKAAQILLPCGLPKHFSGRSHFPDETDHVLQRCVERA